MNSAVVIGSGAGGAMCARELQGKFQVTVLEAGREFRPFGFNLGLVAKLRGTGLLFDARTIEWVFPAMRIHKSGAGMILASGHGSGGTTTLSTGNALRQDGALRKLGINLDEEFAELSREIPVFSGHQKIWRPLTASFFTICREMGLDPQALPKMGNHSHCRSCGRCVLGCPHGIKWDSRQLLAQAQKNGARLLTSHRAERIVHDQGRARAVLVRHGLRKKLLAADLVILAAGGLGTPRILQDSGIACDDSLFVDPVLCVAAEMEHCRQDRELPMPFAVQMNGYIISPYFDHLSFFFNREWRHKAGNIYSLMIKLADENRGGVSGGRVQKTLTAADRERLEGAVDTCAEIFRRAGVDKSRLFFGTLNAGHPGGMLPLTAAQSKTFHHPRLPENLFVADASLFPEALGNPPILTIMAMAKRVARLCRQAG
ncbi:MAG: GMC family oxidoreductase N-terminal domain-containing protein, partial [Acidobacteria bacterium]|nr:GMC family oxidoreductase N-terminal domain-containing protein [Acidobacteriota bacterium]